MKQRVLISGASIAGPAVAFWLSRYGFDVTVVERAPGIRPGGYAVDFRGTADVESQTRLLRETFADMRWPAVSRMLKMMDDSPDFYFDSLSQVKMDGWSKGRVVLLGDAASCTSPMAGMGTSIAVVGAYILAGELKDANGDYAAAFARYEAAMRGFASEAQKLAEGVSWFIPATRLKLWLSSRMWSMMSEATMRKLMIEQPTRIANTVQIKDYS